MGVFIYKESLQHKVISIICAFALVISMALPGSYARAEETAEGGETQSEQIEAAENETQAEADDEVADTEEFDAAEHSSTADVLAVGSDGDEVSIADTTNADIKDADTTSVDGYEWYGDGSADSFTLSDATDLQEFANIVNGAVPSTLAIPETTFEGKTITLASDIDLADIDWTPIGGKSTKHDLTLTSQADLDAALEEHFIIYDSTGLSYVRNSTKNGNYDPNRTYYYVEGALFSGEFDGAGHTISNLSINKEDTPYIGLFGHVNGTVKNLTVSGAVKVTTSSSAVDVDFVGGIVGKLSAGGTIENCVNKALINAAVQETYNVGGIAGMVGEMGTFVSDTNPMATVKNCVNEGDIYGYIRIGGVAGRNAGTVSGCINKGTVFNGSGAKKGTGGIVGMNGVNNAAADAGIIEFCYNLGYVNGNAGYWSGGLAGFQNAKSVTRNSYNAGPLLTSAQANGSKYSWVNPVVGQNEGDVHDCAWLNTDTGDNTKTYVGRDETGVGNAGGTVTNVTGVDATAILEKSTVLLLNANAETNNVSFNRDSNSINNGMPVLSWQGGTLVVEEKSIAGAQVTMPENIYETGWMLFPEPTSVTLDGLDLTLDTDYKISGYFDSTGAEVANVKKAGKYKVKLEGIGDYKDSLTIDFEVIVPANCPKGASPILVKADEGFTITENGTYWPIIEVEGLNDSTGKITLAKGVTDVKFVGQGVAWKEDYTLTDETISGSYKQMGIDASEATGVKITLKNIYFNANQNVGGAKINTINFAGQGNTLDIEDCVLIDHDRANYPGAAAISVGVGDSLTVTGTGTLYLYKRGGGAGFGGESGEPNGDLTFAMTGSMFAKGTQQGALIGAGNNSSKSSAIPGTIEFVSGEYNLITNSRAAAIGGSAGSNGGSEGTIVRVKSEANINVNVDYSGPAVGGGGYDGGNDKSGGTLIMEGGSFRCYVDSNAVKNTSWTGWEGKVVTEGVNDLGITAQRKDWNGRDAYWCVFDTSMIGGKKDIFVVADVSNNEIHEVYRGGKHNYGFYYEGVDREVDNNVYPNSTIGNWYKLTNETNLYFYLSGEDHDLVCGNQKFRAVWNQESKTFTVKKYYNVAFDTQTDVMVASQQVLDGEVAEEPSNPTREGYTFKGWSAAKDGTTAFDFATAITADTTLYAMWEKAADPTPNPNPTPTPDTKVEAIPMYRLYNPNSGEHFYTSDTKERVNVLAAGWSDEKIGWYAPKTSKTPVYRLYNPYGGEHHYTTSLSEKNSLVKIGWNEEGIGWYSDDSQAVALYRQYNPNAFANNHNYTTSKQENDWLVSLGWKAEGIGWYGVVQG